MPNGIRSSNERLGTGEALSRRDRSRFGTYELRQFVENLRNCQAGVEPYVLNGVAIAQNDRNLKANILTNLFTRLGIQEIWTVIDTTRLLSNWPGLSGPSAAVSRAKNELNEFIDTRNEIAHSAGNTAPGPESLRSYINFQRVLAESLIEGLENYTKSL